MNVIRIATRKALPEKKLKNKKSNFRTQKATGKTKVIASSRIFLKATVAAGLFGIIASLAIKPERYIPVCLEGLNLWAIKVLPSLLPFMFFSLILTNFCDITKATDKLTPLTKKLYGTSGIGLFVRIIGLVSGYPAGAKMISELYENQTITKKEATVLSVLSSTSGPSFVIGTVGTAFYADKRLGVIIFLSHAISSLLTSVFFRKNGDNQLIGRHIKQEKTKASLFSTALDCATSMLAVGTLITVFFVLAQVFKDLRITYPLTLLFNSVFKNQKIAEGMVCGLFECTQGCFFLSQCGISAVPFCCAVISFGGLSVIAQSTAFLQKAEVNIKPFVLAKTIHAVISFFVCKFLLLFFF